jgi:HEAT repeat protein
MKSSSSANSNDRLRVKVLLPIALLAGLILIALLSTHFHSEPPPSTPATETTAVTHSEAPTGSANNPAPTRPPIPHVQPPQESETARLASIVFDKTAAIEIRRRAGRSLAKIGTDEAMTVLRSALAGDEPPFLKAAIAEGLGQNPNPEARDLLHELVNGNDQTAARGAARGLAARGDADAVDTLGNLLFNDHTPISVRTEAALALGDVSLPSAQDLLTRAISQIHDEDVTESVLDGLGRRPFSDTQEFFRNYLNSPDVPAESKVLAIESVRDAEGDNVVPFLSTYLNDSNPDVRAAAKEAVDFLNPDAP